MPKRLRVGIIGLGRRWLRYRQALAGLRRQLAVRALCDLVAHRAEAEARRLGCAAAAGPVDLIDRHDVDAVLLLDAQWYGLWPLERACRVGKPFFCGTSLARDDSHADALRSQVRAAGLPVLMVLPAAVAPATQRLRELLAGPLGPARLVRAHRRAPGTGVSPLHSPALLPLLHACADLLGDRPASVWAGAGEGFATLFLEFGAGRSAQLTLWTAPVPGTACRLEAVAEKGTGVAVLPRWVGWRDAAGRHRQHLGRGAPEQALLERFVQALRTGQPPRPSFDDAYQALAWRRAALRSQAEGRLIPLSPPPASAARSTLEKPASPAGGASCAG
jgi:predicted dehydrogenase